MKKAGMIIFLLANFYIVTYYVRDINKYYADTYNYDGIRYLIPLAIMDALFIISLIVNGLALGFSRKLFTLITLAAFHNMVVFTGVENIPFVGLAMVIISIGYALYSLRTDAVNGH